MAGGAEAVKGGAAEAWIAQAAHDLREPVDVLSWCLRGLADVDADPVERARLRDEMARALAFLDAVVANASVLPGSERVPRRDPVNVRALVAGVEAVYRRVAARASLAWRTEVAASVPETVETDAGALSCILGNACSNAVRYTREGGVSLGVGVEAGGAVVWEVADTGTGVSPERVAELFLHPVMPRQGVHAGDFALGIGLTAAARAAAVIGANLTLASNGERGAVFRCVVPRRE